ncbi:hypothetical protein ACIGB6_00095 [Paeniglutamicibacter gangotriensis]|uniref:TetR/AcrR family transcriptional regulator n=1 Tax=Paeniglutamicibacter gangotriensis TaxID=254787 RepID=A0A5B0EAQ7_9MICC|nr:hypothetical protein [Paeniglutamicibacter gangotriensis]KAA0975963.1 hypothetical protein FQ154_12965 [Paeniglutamicibacter gangotriensis]
MNAWTRDPLRSDSGHTPEPTEDLYGSEIVTNVSGRSALTRKRLANGRETRAFLDAALDLTSELFTPALSESLLDTDEDDAPPVMSYLSRRKVLAKAKFNCGADFPLSENMMRHRWSTHGDFLADFVSYALADKHWSLQVALSRHTEELLAGGEDFSKAVHRVAYEDLKLILEIPAYRFQLLAVASSQADAASALAVKRMYKNLSQVWLALYTRVLDHHGFTFRPGVTAEDFNILMQAMAEGLGLRLLSNVDEPLLDDENKTSLLGTAALALLMALVDPGDGLTIEQAIEASMFQRRTAE